MRLLQFGLFCFAMLFVFKNIPNNAQLPHSANPPTFPRSWQNAVYEDISACWELEEDLHWCPSPPIPQNRSSRVYLFIAVDIKWMEWNGMKWGWLPHVAL